MVSLSLVFSVTFIAQSGIVNASTVPESGKEIVISNMSISIIKTSEYAVVKCA
jgi:hypothetical protein